MKNNKKIHKLATLLILSTADIFSCSNDINKANTLIYNSSSPFISASASGKTLTENKQAEIKQSSQPLPTLIPTPIVSSNPIIVINTTPSPSPSPSSAKEYYNLGIENLLNRKYKDAKPLLEKAVELQSDNLTYVFTFTQSLLDIEEYDKALELLLKYRDKFSTDKQLNININYLYRLKGDCNTATQYQSTYFECPLNKKSEIYARRAYFFLSENNRKEALVEFKKALEISPNDLELKLNIASTLKNEENYSESLKYFLEVLPKKPDNQKIIKDIAELYLSLGECTKSNEYYKKINLPAKSCKKLTPIPENLLSYVNLSTTRKAQIAKIPLQKINAVKNITTYDSEGRTETTRLLSCDYRGTDSVENIIKLDTPTNQLYCNYNSNLMQCSTRWNEAPIIIDNDNSLATYTVEQCVKMTQEEPIIPTSNNISTYVNKRIAAVNASRQCNSGTFSTSIEGYWDQIVKFETFSDFIKRQSNSICYQIR